MKIYDAIQESKAWNESFRKNPNMPWSDGYWADDICWKRLLSDGYTHVLTDDGLFVMDKWGCGEKVEDHNPGAV